MTEIKFPALRLYAQISINRSPYFLDHGVVSFILFSIFFFCLPFPGLFIPHTPGLFRTLRGSWTSRPRQLESQALDADKGHLMRTTRVFENHTHEARKRRKSELLRKQNKAKAPSFPPAHVAGLGSCCQIKRVPLFCE